MKNHRKSIFICALLLLVVHIFCFLKIPIDITTNTFILGTVTGNRKVKISSLSTVLVIQSFCFFSFRVPNGLFYGARSLKAADLEIHYNDSPEYDYLAVYDLGMVSLLYYVPSGEAEGKQWVSFPGLAYYMSGIITQEIIAS